MTAQAVFLPIFIVLQVLDAWTTLKALKLGAREANPILAKAFQYLDPLGVLVIAKLFSVWVVWWANWDLLTGLACALYVWVVNNNLDVIQGKK
jgi:hypothetical protein